MVHELSTHLLEAGHQRVVVEPVQPPDQLRVLEVGRHVRADQAFGRQTAQLQPGAVQNPHGGPVGLGRGGRTRPGRPAPAAQRQHQRQKDGDGGPGQHRIANPHMNALHSPGMNTLRSLDMNMTQNPEMNTLHNQNINTLCIGAVVWDSEGRIQKSGAGNAN